MTKAEFIQTVAETHQDLTKRQVTEVMDTVFGTIAANLRKGEKVAWSKFGTFEVTHRDARMGRNPQTGQPIKIAASKGVKFKPAKALKESL